MSYEVQFDSLAQTREFDCLLFRQKPNGVSGGQDMDATQVIVRISGRKPVKVRAADCGEKQRKGVSRHFGAQEVVVNQAPYSGEAASRRARTRKSFARE